MLSKLTETGSASNINGEYITHLSFAFAIAIMAELLQELNTMLTMLSHLSIVSQQASF